MRIKIFLLLAIISIYLSGCGVLETRRYSNGYNWHLGIRGTSKQNASKKGRHISIRKIARPNQSIDTTYEVLESLVYFKDSLNNADVHRLADNNTPKANCKKHANDIKLTAIVNKPVHDEISHDTFVQEQPKNDVLGIWAFILVIFMVVGGLVALLLTSLLTEKILFVMLCLAIICFFVGLSFSIVSKVRRRKHGSENYKHVIYGKIAFAFYVFLYFAAGVGLFYLLLSLLPG